MLFRWKREWIILVWLVKKKKSCILRCYWNPKHFQVLCMAYNSKDRNFPSLFFLFVLTFSNVVNDTRLTSLENIRLSWHRLLMFLMIGLFHSDLWSYFFFHLSSLCWVLYVLYLLQIMERDHHHFLTKKPLVHSSCINHRRHQCEHNHLQWW